MGFVIYILELLFDKLGINLGGAYIGMTEHLLNGAKIGSVFKKMRRKGMTKGMRSNGLFNSCLDLIGLYKLPESLT